MSITNITRVFEQADAFELNAGREYYQKTHDLIYTRAVRFSFAPEVCFGVFAAMSPNNDEAGNYRDMDSLLTVVGRQGQYESFNVSTWGPNKLKAWRIARYGESPLSVLGGAKVRSFYRNMRDPADKRVVTIDGHCYNIWHGKRVPLRRKPGTPAPEEKASYQEVANGFRAVAKQAGVLPCQLQATVWMTWKRIHKILYQAQLPLLGNPYELPLMLQANTLHLVGGAATLPRATRG